MSENTDWARMPYFLAVARGGSLRAAAEAAGATHATVNRNLRALEADYGVRLFERSKAGLALTPAGEALLPLAEEAEAAVIGARRRLEGLDREASGAVRVSVPPGMAEMILPPILARFSEAYPDIELEVRVTVAMEDLTRRETDVSVRVAFEVSDDVIGRRLVRYSTGIFGSEDYIARELPRAGPHGEGLTWIGWGDPVTPTPAWVRESPFPKAALRHTVRDWVTVAALVRQGLGLSHLPVFTADYMPGLVRVPGTPVTPDRSIWLLLHADLRQVTRVRLFVDHLAAEIRALRPVFLGPLA